METRRGPLTTSILRYPSCGHSHKPGLSLRDEIFFFVKDSP